MNKTNVLAIGTAVLVFAGRYTIPTVGLSWPVTFQALSHIWAGVLIALLWQARGKWITGWICLTIPTVLEASSFFLGHTP